ncbi:MAG: Asp-tRNA(Asn)/Glu-tRNA(Gln) amidotransferase subunit GatB, partial [Oscillospiraceae bacterium]
MKEYEIVVGLETHVELATETKIFCGCKNAFGSEVNANCCPVCAGLPGALPTLNEKVIAYAIKMGFATNCSINPVSKMDRKNYFYPDLPKAYQISQFDVPVCENGYVDVILNEQGDTKRINLERIHIEEDAGKLIHDDAFDGTLVDLNRSGVPLIEIVTRPDFRSGAEAKAYLTTLKSILGYIGVSDCKMQEGSIRCDVNLSVREKGSEKFGTRTEMKNISTFSGVERAIDYEAKRQIAIIENGGSLKLETRKWDDAKGENSLLRIKENEPDYRCFPEPDLMTIVVEKQTIDEIRAS